MVRIKQIVGIFTAMLLVLSNGGMAFASPIAEAAHVNLLGGPQVFTNNGANCGWSLQYYGPNHRQWVQNCSQTNTAATVTNYGERDQGITKNWVANRGAMQTIGACGWYACPPPQPVRFRCRAGWCVRGLPARNGVH